MSRPHAPRSGDVVGRNYAIERPLGEGGMGRVYLARHAVTGRRVALKIVRTDDAVLRERVLREARSMGRLSHPNVVGVLDAGEDGDAVFVVMEYVEGCDLRTYAQGKRLGTGSIVDLLMPAMSGVAAAHQAGILHRDLKPENLFVCTDVDGSGFDTKVLDFGVAKNIDDAETSLTSSGTIVGTPKYMAPEQFMSGDDLDARVDVYALGLILYELLAGRLPYQTASLKTMVVEILAGNVEPLHGARPDLPAALCGAVMTALANEREQRFTDVASFARALEPFAGHKRFQPPRPVHTPETSLEEVTSPEFEAISARTRSSGSGRRPAARAAAGVPAGRGAAERASGADKRWPASRERTKSGKPVASRAAFADMAVASASTLDGQVGAVPMADAGKRAAPGGMRRALLVIAGLALALIALGIGLRALRSEPEARAPARAPAAKLELEPAAVPGATAETSAGAQPAASAEPVAPAAQPVAAPAAEPPAAAEPPTAEPSPTAEAAPRAAPPSPAPERTRSRRTSARGAAVGTSSAARPAGSSDPAVKTRGGTLRTGDF